MTPPIRKSRRNCWWVMEGGGAKVQGQGKPWPKKVCVFLHSLAILPEFVYKLRSFWLQATPTAMPPFASWPKWLFSGPLVHEQPFHQILCKSVNLFWSYALFCKRPLPLPRCFKPVNTNTHLLTQTLDFLAKFQPPSTITVAAKKWAIFEDRPTDRVIYKAAGRS